MQNLQFASLPQMPFAMIKTIGEFKDFVGSFIGIIVILSFLFGVCSFIYGIVKRDSDPTASKSAFITAFLFGLALPVVGLMFALTGSGAAVVDAKFN